MIATISCAALKGIDGFKVRLEVDFSRSGMPAFTMVGLAEGAVRESKERVFAALKNSGFKIPPARITVNLAPADIRKGGSGYDLPLALGLLVASGILPAEPLKGWFFSGELSLDGGIKSVAGVLPLAVLAREEQAAGLMVAPENAAEAAVAEGVSVFAPRTLAEAVQFFSGELELEPVPGGVSELWAKRDQFPVDFSEVKGQEHAKRAIEIAAAGGHNLLMQGLPGCGKTMLASRIPTVLPSLSFDEALEVTKIYSVAGLLDGEALKVSRSYRSPHHTISDAGLIGGGAYPKPGEVSLAHRGVLFLDELPEFKKQVLEVLRQPLEGGKVTLARAAVSLAYPADFMLVAAMNPCPCGYYGDPRGRCTCTPHDIQRYRNKVSGPLLDRIDLHVDVPAVEYKDLQDSNPGISSAQMRECIAQVREVQAERYANTPLMTNADLSGRWLDEHCRIGASEHAFLEKAVSRLGLSARAYTRVLRIARTIADIGGERDIGVSQLAEAINYRSFDRQT